MKWWTIANVINKALWIGGLVVLVLNGHNWWAFACFIGAVSTGFEYKSTGKKQS